MLKWTSMQKLPETPKILNKPNEKRSINRERRATINNVPSNKENLITSTPVVGKKCIGNSPLLLEEFLALTPPPNILLNSTSKACKPSGYASTLPKYNEEYSPNIMSSGHIVAMRGLLPDSYIGNPRYINKTPINHLKSDRNTEKFDGKSFRKILTRKRKLENDFNKSENFDEKTTTLNSTKMGDVTLDKLIDAILDSTKKDKNKRKTPRKSLNLRRKTLLKNSTNIDLILSPSYKPAEDPCSDLSFSELKNFDEAELKNDSQTSGISSKSKRKLSSSEENYSNSKKTRRNSNSRKYFEVGLALPSIYV